MNPNDLVSKDADVMRLAHPFRCAAAWRDEFPSWEKILSPYTWNALRQAFGTPGRLTPAVLTELMADPRNRMLQDFVQHSAQDASSTELGGAYATAIFWRQTLFPQPHFVVEDALLEMLEHTDISDDLPMSVLKPPYPRCYIELGKSRTCEQVVPNMASGLHILEGGYIEEGTSRGMGPGIFITFTGSPLGKENALDDATDSIFLPTVDPDRLIRDVMDEARVKSQRLSVASNLRSSPDEYAQYSFSCLKLLIKVLLYLGLPEARKSLQLEYSDFKKQVQAKKNPAKRAKAEKLLSQMSDYILVSAPPPVHAPGIAPFGEEPGMRRHWRRGHYRLQPHGPQSSLRKVIFMQPMLVGSATLGTEAQTPKYRVR